jgi:hypothetical protein
VPEIFGQLANGSGRGHAHDDEVATSIEEESEMNHERAYAYQRVMRTLEELGPSKLLDGEQDRIRYAADNLIFSRVLTDDVAALDALDDVERLCRGLVQSGRWEAKTATRLADDVSQCGPAMSTELKAA